MSAFITPHFPWLEAQCHDGGEIPDGVKPDIRRVAMVMERIREEWAKTRADGQSAALIPNSWYRSPSYNKAIGGAAKSRHMLGDAVDFHPVSRLDIPRLIVLIENMLEDGKLPEVGGFGKYVGWVHIDLRPRKPNGSIARWLGKGVGSETA